MPPKAWTPIRAAFRLLALLIALTAAPVWAHKVNIFAYVESGTVYTESYFPDGKKVAGSEIEVLDSTGTVLLKGTTDPQGLFAFPLPAKQELTLVLNAGMGHKGSFVLKKEEM